MEKKDIDKNVFDAMGDNVSKQIYINKVNYYNDANNAMEAIICLTGGQDILNFMDENKDSLCVFGAGMLGQDLVDTWSWKYKFRAFIDNDKLIHGKKIKKIPVISLDELNKFQNDPAIIIMSKFYWREIFDQLTVYGIGANKIFNFGEIYCKFVKNQYFDLEELKITDHERFVDCGVLDGETSLNLLELRKGQVEKIWMFEPDKNNILKVKNSFKDKVVDYEIVEKGVWSCQTKLHFNSRGDGCACIDNNGEDVIETIKLDDVLMDCNPTFIKMDIEGAEYEALKGAENIIRKYHPKLAISVYHKPEDIFELPSLILEYNPGYKIYLRHYSLTSSETILYAI